jgi:predicted permease
MSVLTEWINRLRHFGHRRQFEAGLEDEIRFHVETRVAELEDAGLSRFAALSQAHREFGSVALAREESRGAWQFRWLQDFAADIRHGLRTGRRSPAFTLTAVLSLALGIGGTSAIYSALDAVLWKPLPVENPDTLVTFSVTRESGHPMRFLPAAFVNQLRAASLFAGVTIVTDDGLSFSYDGRAERVLGEVVSPGYFELLGVRPLLGEGFTPEVRRGHWAPEAVLSYHFWKRRFGGDPTIVGRTIRLNTYPFTIVGVSPPSFSGLVRGTDYELRIPILPDGQEAGQINQISGAGSRWLGAVARLGPGTGISQAETAADAQFQAFLRATPAQELGSAGLRHLRVTRFARGDDEYVRSFRTPLYVLLILVAVVLLIACSNVAGMLLARATARARELAIRASIGAGRSRLIRQMLAESILLSMVGGGLGIAVAYWAADVLFHFLPQGHVRLAVVLHPDSRALLFTFALSLLTGLLFGLAPAVAATRGSLAGALKSDSAAPAGAGNGARARKVLVASQVAFSMALLIAAGIFVQTVSDLRPADYSSPSRILLFTLKPPQEIYSDDRKRALVAELIRRVSAVPGVESAALAENGPLGSRTDATKIQAPGNDPIQADLDWVTPGFFDTVGIRRVAGRDFTPADKPGSPLVAIINQALGRALFPHRNPLGETIKIPRGEAAGDYRIAGMAADTRYYDVRKAPEPVVWLSMGQIPPYMPTLHVRTATLGTAGVIAAIRRAFYSLDTGFPVFNIRTMTGRIEDSLASERMVATLSGAFGVLALVLAAVGLYGILAYSVSRRTREIGIRMALGASSGSVLYMIAREAMLLVGAGCALGLALTFAARPVFAHYLDGVSQVDLGIIAASTAGMLLVAAAAVAVPAIRGCRVDPLRALRHD